MSAAKPLPSTMVYANREGIRRLAGRHRLGCVRVFGSVARGQDTRSSDVDLLVTPGPGVSLFDMMGFKLDVEDLTGYKVDVISDRALDAESEIVKEAVAL